MYLIFIKISPEKNLSAHHLQSAASALEAVRAEG
jgi:hypothetical protein